MNAWGYIALISIGVIAGMILHWYMVRDRIQNRKIEIRKNKQKNGEGNIQDLDIEMGSGQSSDQGSVKEEKRAVREEKRRKRKAEKSIKQTINNSNSIS